MLDLRTLDPARQSADRRVALVAGFVVVATCTLASVAAGGGGWALAWGGTAALGGLPWVFAFGGRWRLLDDALARRPVRLARRPHGRVGDRPRRGRAGRAAGSSRALGASAGLAFSACLLGAAAYTALIAWVEARYERAILLDLTVLELALRADHRHPPVTKGSDPLTIKRRPQSLKDHQGSDPAVQAEGEARVGVRAADGDLEVQVRAGREAGCADAADAGCRR